MGKNKNQSMSWEDFQSLGNPQNVDAIEENISETNSINSDKLQFRVRIFLDKKNRKGKKATVIKGIDLDDEILKEMCREMKSFCGVGGSSKDGEILLQGDQRKRIHEFLVEITCAWRREIFADIGEVIVDSVLLADEIDT